MPEYQLLLGLLTEHNCPTEIHPHRFTCGYANVITGVYIQELEWLLALKELNRNWRWQPPSECCNNYNHETAICSNAYPLFRGATTSFRSQLTRNIDMNRLHVEMCDIAQDTSEPASTVVFMAVFHRNNYWVIGWSSKSKD